MWLSGHSYPINKTDIHSNSDQTYLKLGQETLSSMYIYG